MEPRPKAREIKKNKNYEQNKVKWDEREKYEKLHEGDCKL